VTYPAHQLYDWTTCTAGPCQAFSGNVIPLSRIDPVVSKAMSYFPKPQNDSVYNNFLQNSSTTTEANLFTAKIDQYISSNQKISGSWSYDDRPLIASSNLGAIFTTENPTQFSYYDRFNYDFTISPTVINQFTAGFSETHRAEVEATV
jgi:hypothetical protein